MADVCAILTGPMGPSEDRNSSPTEQTLLDLLRHGRREDALRRAESNPEEVNHSDDGSTPLLVATTRGWGDVVEALINHGANVNVVSELGETPLMRAVKCGKIASGIIKMILDHGGVETLNHAAKESAFFSKWTALHFACDIDLNHHPIIIALLVSYGANIKAVAANGKTPLDMCAEKPECMKALTKPKDYLKHHQVSMRPQSDDDEARVSGEAMQLGSETTSDEAPRSSLLQSALHIFSKPKKSSLIEAPHPQPSPSPIHFEGEQRKSKYF